MKRSKKQKGCSHKETNTFMKKSPDKVCGWDSRHILWICFHEEFCPCGANLGRSAECPNKVK